MVACQLQPCLLPLSFPRLPCGLASSRNVPVPTPHSRLPCRCCDGIYLPSFFFKNAYGFPQDREILFNIVSSSFELGLVAWRPLDG